MISFLIGYAAGGATVAIGLYLRFVAGRARQRKAQREFFSGLLGAIERGGLVPIASLSDPEGPCDDPECTPCVARKKAAARAEWAKN
jgi:hypothetical protein